MAVGALDTANTSISSLGNRITLQWDAPSGDGWTSPFILSLTPSAAISLAVDTGGPKARTITGSTINGATSIVGSDLSASFNLSGYIEYGETVSLTLTAGLFADSTITPDTSGGTSGTAITNSSTFVGLASLTNLKLYLGVTGSSNDTELIRYLQVATSVIERHCGRGPGKFLSQTHTEALDGKGSRKIQVRNTPITSITSINRVLSDGSLETIDSGNYRFESETGEIELIGDDDQYYYAAETNPFLGRRVFGTPEFSRGFRNVQVVHVGGYTPATLPPALSQAAIEIAAYLFRRQGRDTTMGSESLGDYSYSIADPESVSASLKMWRNAVGCVVIA